MSSLIDLYSYSPVVLARISMVMDSSSNVHEMLYRPAGSRTAWWSRVVVWPDTVDAITMNAIFNRVIILTVNNYDFVPVENYEPAVMQTLFRFDCSNMAAEYHPLHFIM